MGRACRSYSGSCDLELASKELRGWVHEPEWRPTPTHTLQCPIAGAVVTAQPCPIMSNAIELDDLSKRRARRGTSTDPALEGNSDAGTGQRATIDDASNSVWAWTAAIVSVTIIPCWSVHTDQNIVPQPCTLLHWSARVPSFLAFLGGTNWGARHPNVT